MNITGSILDRPIVTESNNISINLAAWGAFINKGSSETATATAVITTKNIAGTMANLYALDASNSWTGVLKISYFQAILFLV